MDVRPSQAGKQVVLTFGGIDEEAEMDEVLRAEGDRGEIVRKLHPGSIGQARNYFKP